MSDYEQHKAHHARAGVATPCAAWHRTFAGRCLNCGYVAGGYDSVRQLVPPRDTAQASSLKQ